jgi:hypothetical protein
MTRITVWLDPGKTTGMASWDSRNDAFTSLEASDLESVGGWIEMLLAVNSDEPDLHIEIGWERYVITPAGIRGGTPYWSLEVIGVARYFALKHNLTILNPQMSSMMAIATDERLKLINWYKPGKRHANDAARHLFHHMITTNRMPVGLYQKIFSSPRNDDEARLAAELEAWGGELPPPGYTYSDWVAEGLREEM